MYNQSIRHNADKHPLVFSKKTICYTRKSNVCTRVPTNVLPSTTSPEIKGSESHDFNLSAPSHIRVLLVFAISHKEQSVVLQQKSVPGCMLL